MNGVQTTPPQRDADATHRRVIRAMVTVGPTEEPIDAVRFIGNRSSGRMGLAIAEALLAPSLASGGASGGASDLELTVAIGPIRVDVPMALAGHGRVRLLRFRSSRDLQALLEQELPSMDLVVMAAAVADYRPTGVSEGKLRRSADGLRLDLEGVPDLLASTRSFRKPGARVYGFALEPRERLVASALDKMTRKDLAGIVANPLETMDAPDVDGTLFLRDGSALSPGGRVSKEAFASWLVARIVG